MTEKLILITYTGVGEAGFGGMFALAGGFKATITARLNGADLEVRGFPLGEGKLYEWGLAMRRLDRDEVPEGVYTYRKDPAFVKATGGYGTIPALLAPDGSVGCCESNAIARMVARQGRTAALYGTTAWETAQIDMFLDKCLVFERDMGPWIDHTLFGASGGFELGDKQLAMYEAEAGKWLSAIDRHLARTLRKEGTPERPDEGRDWLVGDRVSVADVVLACQMLVPWCCMLGEAARDHYKNLARHLDKLWQMPAFAADLGEAVRVLTKEFARRQGQVESQS